VSELHLKASEKYSLMIISWLLIGFFAACSGFISSETQISRNARGGFVESNIAWWIDLGKLTGRATRAIDARPLVDEQESPRMDKQASSRDRYLTS
jgi:hypothetical protein